MKEMIAQLNLSRVAVPVMDRQQFALQVGVSPDTVQGWIRRGYLPIYPIGRRRLINVEVLKQILRASC